MTPSRSEDLAVQIWQDSGLEQEHVVYTENGPKTGPGAIKIALKQRSQAFYGLGL